jgi:hypothetical protein
MIMEMRFVLVVERLVMKMERLNVVYMKIMKVGKRQMKRFHSCNCD